MKKSNYHISMLLLRIGLGAMMLTHGIPKLLTYSERSTEFANPIGVGPEISLILTIFAEVFCSILIIIGYKTRWALIPLVITMAVAAFIVHGDDPFSRQEKALLYLVGYLTIFLTGPGKFSIDQRSSN